MDIDTPKTFGILELVFKGDEKKKWVEMINQTY